MLRNPTFLFVFLAVSASQLFAQRSAHATLQVTVRIEGSLSAVFTADSMPPVQATGSSSASFSVPTVGGSFSNRSATIAAGDTTLLVSEPFAIAVHKANLQSASYSLRASLAMSDAVRAWKIDSLALLAGKDQLIAVEQPYAVANPHSLVVSGPAAGPVNFANVINFMIVAN